MCPTDNLEEEVKEDEVLEEGADKVSEADVQVALAVGQPSKVESSIPVLEEVESKVSEKEYDRMTDKEKEKYGI